MNEGAALKLLPSQAELVRQKALLIFALRWAMQYTPSIFDRCQFDLYADRECQCEDHIRKRTALAYLEGQI